MHQGPVLQSRRSHFLLRRQCQPDDFRLRLDLGAGTVSNKREFASAKGLGGVPDGATVDADGNLWSAIAGGGKLVCYKADCSISRR
jgi:sugar lactone lactonase YvrE